MTPKENDIYRWAWKEGRAPIIGHYAHLAVFSGGALRDTYWCDWKTQSHIELDRVDLTLLGNIDECDVISRWQRAYYDPSDVIDMAHNNNSNAPIYLKRTATKSQEWMLARAEEKFAEANRSKERAERDITDWAYKIKQIKAGDLEVYL